MLGSEILSTQSKYLCIYDLSRSTTLYFHNDYDESDFFTTEYVVESNGYKYPELAGDTQKV